jgi:EAL domain-containing protein (putative c-di-GMP-specific phosphodiesterase class I)
VTPMASIGVAVHTFEADAGELLKRADVAMYTAKRNGKGRFEEFQASMSLNSTDRHQLRLDLQRAVADQDFTLEFQPVLAIASGEIEGVEALLRWRDPRRGPQRAADFVTVAEETGLIIPIGRMVVHAACRQAAVWLARFPEIRVFVNVSARELAHREIVNVVGAALAMSRLEPSHLVLEVTETAMMRDIDEAKEVLYALKALGVGLAIDDFGTGFSSLSYLRDLPIDVLKIAKPIIASICDSPRDAAFVRGIVELGHVVGARVVAEGVEHLEQHSEVIAAGCDYAQGYYYAPPMTADGIVQVLQTSVEARRLLGQLSASS